MSQHTPGPWALSRSPMAATFVMSGETWLAEVSRIEEGEANARLIAAAPEMWAILRRIATGERENWFDIPDDARALLARIEGA